jgi:outer membrane protein assembly factor BamD
MAPVVKRDDAMHQTIVLCCALIVLLAGCASQPVEDTRAAAELYRSAQAAMSRGDYVTAVQEYEQLQARYPFGPYAEQAQLDIIYAYAEAGEPESAIAAAERFIRLNPRHPEVDYAWYMRGVVQQERGSGFLADWFDLKRSARDPEPLREAFNTFSTLVERYPDSRYAEDARERMFTIRNLLAEHEIMVARFYAERGAWVAAANRAANILQRYPGAPATADALVMLQRSYGELELSNLQSDVRRILELNGMDPESADA